MEILVYSGQEVLGDGVMKLPFVYALRRSWPDARITWLAGKGPTVYSGTLAPLVEGCIDEIIEDAGIGSQTSELWRRRPLPGRRFDLVIDTQRRVLTSFILRRIRTRCFISGAADFLLSSRRPPRPIKKPESMVGQMMALLSLAGGTPTLGGSDIALPPEWTAAAAALLPDGPVYIGIAPGASMATKIWPLDRFIAIARRQLDRGHIPVFFVGPMEAGFLAELRDAVPQARFPLQDAAAEPSPLLTVALAQRLAAAVANDSGAGHLLAAGGCAMVSLFGPTRPQKFAPAARRLAIVDARDFGEAEMTSIAVDTVAASLEEILSAP
ncbi:MAG: lipopolysaccharide heptosyltransferase family protein [Rhodospirillales bacterium]|nr:lipopolysaccharide heptosyltransferase family protein [Rhodospirillales bacterium]